MNSEIKSMSNGDFMVINRDSKEPKEPKKLEFPNLEGELSGNTNRLILQAN